MLCLSRKIGEEIVIDGKVVVSVLSVVGRRVKLGFEAPRQTTINRREVEQQIHKIRPAA